MKRFLVLSIVLVTLMSAVCALAASGDAVLGRSEDGTSVVYYNTSFADKDTLYLVSNDSLSTWHVGDTDAVSYDFQFPAKEGEEDVTWSCWPFAAKDSVYAIALATRYGEYTEFLRAVLCEVNLKDENGKKVAELKEKSVLNWDNMINSYEQSSTVNEPQRCIGIGNLCGMLIYDEDASLQLKLLNVDTGEITTAKGLSDISAIIPYKDGRLLIEQYSYDDDSCARFVSYDPRDNSYEELSRVSVDNGSAFTGMAYNSTSDTLYCIKGGEIHSIDLHKGELGPAIADAPAEYINDGGSSILSGKYYCHAYYGAFIRNLDASQRKETRIRVYDNSNSDSIWRAAGKLPSIHSGVCAAIDQDFIIGKGMDESLRNHDGSIDVYIVNSSHKAFKAAFTRGDMAELDGSENLSALAQRMYPDIRSALSRNGHLVGIPVTCCGSAFAVNEKALERLGLKIDDVPRNWSDMLEFISRLAERIKSDDNVSLFYENQSYEDAKKALLNQILYDYQSYADYAGADVRFDSELMKELLNKLDEIDFARFGCRHESENAEESYVEPEGDSAEDDKDTIPLFETLSACTFDSYYSYTPILMSMDGKTPACLALNMNVAFVNPNSSHPKEALLFMEALANCLDSSTLYAIDPNLDTPIRNRYYAETKNELNAALLTAKESYETADAKAKRDLFEQIRILEQEIDDFENMSWDISQRNIDWYRANDEHIVLQTNGWANDGDEDNAISMLIGQYISGEIDASAMLAGIDMEVDATR